MPVHSQNTQYWGLAVLNKITAKIYIYDPSPGLSSFTRYTSALRLFGDSLRKVFHLEERPHDIMIQENISAVQAD